MKISIYTILLTASLLFTACTEAEVDQYIADNNTQDVIVDADVNTLNTKPNVELNVSASTIIEGEAITFDATASTDIDGNIESYSWKDENGNELSLESIFTYTFDTNGVYQVTLTVVDDQGLSNEISITITVNALVCPNASLQIRSDLQNDPTIYYTITLDEIPTGNVHITMSSEYYYDVWGQGFTLVTVIDPTELNVSTPAGQQELTGKVHVTVPFGDIVDEKGYILQIDNIVCN